MYVSGWRMSCLISKIGLLGNIAGVGTRREGALSLIEKTVADVCPRMLAYYHFLCLTTNYWNDKNNRELLFFNKFSLVDDLIII